jgi:hypothetical protein
MTTRILHARRTVRPAHLLGSATIATIFALGGCQPPPPAQPDDANIAQPSDETPAAADVLEAGVAAIGGRDVIDSIESYYSESNMEVKGQNMQASTKIWWKKGSFYSETDMEGVGVTKVWRNDDGVWSDDPINGWRKLDGKEARQAEWSNTLSLVADWQKFFTAAEITGRRTHEDLTLIDVVLTSDDGDEITMSFDTETGLLRQQLFEQETPMGVMPITVDIEEYTTYGGLKQPARSVTNMSVVDAVSTVAKFEINLEIDDAKFQPSDPKNAEAEPEAEPKAEPKAKKK